MSSVIMKAKVKVGDVEEEWQFENLSFVSPKCFIFITELVCPNKGLTELSADLPNLILLDCIGNNLKSIPNYPNLEYLYATKNSLVSIGNYPKLKILYCKRNNLTEIGNYPLLEELSCEFNNITDIYCQSTHLYSLRCQVNNLRSIPFFPNLVSLYCQDNHLTSIPVFPNLIALYCSRNQITEIPEMVNIKYLVCDHNRLNKLPNLTNWRQLETIDYSNNEIIYIPPDVTRILNTIGNNRQKRKTLTIYDDSQNVHNHQIQESIRESIKAIIKDKPHLNMDELLSEIIASTDLDEDCKHILVEFSEDKEVHTALGITFKELLLSVWSIIRTHPNKTDISNVLNTEMKDSICKCFTGRMSRLINCLNGYDPRVKVEMPLNDQIANVILMIEKHLTENNNYSVELHRQLVTKELLSRGFQQSEINVWVEHIE